MIDLHVLRENRDEIVARLKAKDPSYDGMRLWDLDARVRALRAVVEQLRCQKNERAKLAGKAGITDEARAEAKRLSDELTQHEQDLRALEIEFRDHYLRCPNIPMEDLPVGDKAQNQVVRMWGEKPTFTFAPQHHVALNDRVHWFDMAAAARMASSNFVLYQGTGARLIYALTMFMLRHNESHGYRMMLPPYLVNAETLEGASNFPRFRDAVYEINEDKLFLTPTAEVNLTSLYRDHTFADAELPVRMTAWTSCFRREAGTYGASERGLIRIHQFEKVELYTLCTPEQSADEQDRMIACAEGILQKLGLHYRVSLLATQDSSFASAKTYDIEVWMPGQGEYKEVSSASRCDAFQSRRCNIRHKNAQGKTALVHTLNGSSLALPRLMVALMETYQQADGSIILPEVLRTISWSMEMQ